MGQTGRRSIATHILAVKIALTAVHFHGFGVAWQWPWNTWVHKESEMRKGLFAGIMSCVESVDQGETVWLPRALSGGAA
jgi:hypothetical protein